MSTSYKYVVFDKVYNVHIVKEKYANGRTALELLSNEDGSPVACASVNIPEYDLQPGEILIKTWSENEEMLAFLTRNRIVEDTGRDVPAGYVNARVCKLLI